MMEQSFRTPPCPRVTPKGAEKAFSLIEIVIALGIISTVMVALLGMVSFGVTSVKDSVDTATAARVLDEIVADLQLADWEDLSKFDREERFYDDQGTPVRESSPFVVYVARTDLESDGVAFPGGSRESPHLKRVRLRVGVFPDGNVDFSEGQNRAILEDVTTWVAKFEKDGFTESQASGEGGGE